MACRSRTIIKARHCPYFLDEIAMLKQHKLIICCKLSGDRKGIPVDGVAILNRNLGSY
jgi:hypothetical protein